MRTLLIPRATQSFYKFATNEKVSIEFLSCLTGEKIESVKNIEYKCRENLDISCLNDIGQVIHIKLRHGFGEYRKDRVSFKESFEGYWWKDLKLEYDKLYNIALMGFCVRNNDINDSEEVIYSNNYMLKTKEKDSNIFYINVDVPYYEKSMESDLDKWIYILQDVWEFDELYHEQDIHSEAVECFVKEKYTEEEYYYYENSLGGLRDSYSCLISAIEEVHRKVLKDEIFDARIDLSRLLKEKGISATEISERVHLPIEIIRLYVD